MTRTLFALALLTLAGCTPTVAQDVPPARIIALFDPAAATPVLPLPNDLVLDGTTGLLNVPDGERDSPAQKDFNAWLRTLDGFPTAATPWLEFSGRLDSTTITAQSVRVLDLTDPRAVVELQGVTRRYDAQTSALSLEMQPQRAKTYGVAVVGTAGGGVRGADGQEVIGSPVFALVRARRPLVTCADLASADCASVTALLPSTEAALTLERARRRMQPGLEYLAAQGIQREQLAAFWTFSTAGNPQATFDPAGRIIPFPNELLMSNGKVSLPAEPGDDPLTIGIKAQLNQLDGFSTSASLLTESGPTAPAADARLDAATLLPEHFLLVNMDDVADPPVPVAVACRSCAGPGKAHGLEPDQVALKPQKPLRSHTRYAALWLEGGKGLDGRPVRANATFALARSRHPLVVNSRPTVSTLDSPTAILLEGLRQQLQPALEAADARGIPRERVVLGWHFKTQTTSTALVELGRKPAAWALPTALLGPLSTLAPDPNNAQDPLDVLSFVSTLTGADLTSAIRSFHEGEFNSVNALDPSGVDVDPSTQVPFVTDGAFTAATLAAPKTEVRRFLLALPKVPRFADGRIPVVLFLHGLGESRGNAGLIANTIAKAGYATLAIDAPFHGLRSYCRVNADCAAGVTCGADHRCPDTLASATDGYKVRILNLPTGPINDPSGTPVISGQGFIASSNPFASRDHFRHQVIDVAQLLRSLRDTATGIGSAAVDDPATAGVTERLDPVRPVLIGQSLGGMMGALVAAALPEIEAATLNVLGASLTDVLLESPGLGARAQLDAALTAQGKPPGSQAYEAYFDLGRWILDPADPQCVGRHFIDQPLLDPSTQQPFARKKVFVSWMEGDSIIPNATTEIFLRSIEAQAEPTFFKQTKYQGGSHVFLLDVSSFQNGALAMTAQADAVNWVKQ